MTRAYVYTILPSLMTSFKISSMGETIGTMTQDRPTAIAGTLGKGPALVPMTVTLERSAEGTPTARCQDTPKRTFKYSLVNDQMFTPLIAYVAMFNTLASLRAAVRRLDDRRQEPRAHQGPRGSERRRRLHRRLADSRAPRPRWPDR